MHFFIQFIENQGLLHVSNITCSSSVGATQTTFGILRAYNVSCTAVAQLQVHCTETVPQPCSWHYTHAIPNAVCLAPTEDEQEGSKHVEVPDSQ
jgi:hypothetical protein